VQRISINELPKYSRWVARLLGLDSFKRSVRTLAKVDAEYDKDKYAKLLAYYQSKRGATFQEIKARDPRVAGLVGQREICISKDSQLFLTSPDNYLRLAEETFIDALAEPLATATVVVELGCGWGYNFTVLNEAYPNRFWIGGEYSQNAIKLASLLFKDYNNISVLPFNWYDDSWPIFEAYQGKAIVFTRQSIEQLPHASQVLPTFKKYREKIIGVVHLEPAYELADQESTLGLMRRAYTRMNDYNTDLLTTIKAMDVKILKTQYDLIGGNPLNPESFIYWQF